MTVPKQVSEYLSKIGSKGGKVLSARKLKALKELARRPRNKNKQKV